MSFPLVGLESILKDKAFNAAISNYLASMDKVDDKTTTAAGRIGKTFQNIGALAVGGGLALAVSGVTRWAQPRSRRRKSSIRHSTTSCSRRASPARRWRAENRRQGGIQRPAC
jgi:hypothetical protein